MGGGIVGTLLIENHNLSDGDHILIEDAQGITDLNDNIYDVTVLSANTVTVIETTGIAGTYTGGGTAARISNINILTKQYNFYVNQSKSVYIPKVEFYVDKTVNGQITVESMPSTSQIELGEYGELTGSIVGTRILETTPYTEVPIEAAQAQLWHPMYLQAEGETIQLRLFFNPDQMRDVDIVTSDFQLNAMVFYAQPVSRL